MIMITRIMTEELRMCKEKNIKKGYIGVGRREKRSIARHVLYARLRAVSSPEASVLPGALARADRRSRWATSLVGPHHPSSADTQPRCRALGPAAARGGSLDQRFRPVPDGPRYCAKSARPRQVGAGSSPCAGVIH